VYAAQQPFGYSTFLVPLDDYLKYGEANTVRVDARAHDDSRWYTGAGIYRDTVLIVTNPIHVEPYGLQVTTPDIDAERAVVEIVITLANSGIGTQSVTASSQIRNADGIVVAAGTSPVTLRAGATAVARHRLYVTEPSLWSVEDPALYTAQVRLSNDHDTLDERSTSFGIRSLKLDPMHGLRINGETVKLRGACIHHDNGLLGAATIGRAEERRIEILKSAGFNAIRSAHNPISQAMLDACDRLGMLVMDETFDVWTEGKSAFDYSLSFPEWWERDVEAFIAKNFNHPSVIFYSIGNEIPETGTPLGSEWGRKLAEKVRALDNTRFVTNGINGFVSAINEIAAMMAQYTTAQSGDGAANGGVNDMMNSPGDMMNRVSASELVTRKTAESFSVLDVAGMNYGDARYELDRELFPGRIIIGTETFPPRIAHNWKLVENNAHVLGDFTWTGWDYLGEVGIGRVQYSDVPPQFEAPFPWLTAWCGDIDITGHRRPASYYREIVFGLRREPYIAVQRPENHGRGFRPGQWSWTDSISSWAWPTEDGAPIKVEVYSAAEEVELLLNGLAVGRQGVGPDHEFRTEFDLTYQPGELVAVAYAGGVEQSRTALLSAKGPSRLTATPDRTSLVHNDQDLCFVAIELRDGAGTLATGEDVPVSIAIAGAAELKAFGSARPDNAERFDAGVHTTFDGRALAIVRPIGEGEATVMVSADGFEPVTIGLNVRAAP
ncbi:MAG: DUF4982 domain-containing protein, partial [Halioglobus sp.]|nr:DUF4982 domain-containing protein [Halioglobus sp.]